MSHLSQRPLVAHIIYRLSVGGLENGLVNLINNMPAEHFRHVIICLTEYTDFRFRIKRKDVECYALGKRDGHDFKMYGRLWNLLRELQPKIVHTRNLATLECQLPAVLSGVAVRIHGEHGRDMRDIDGTNWKYRLVRKAIWPFVNRYVTVSKDLERWLADVIGGKRAVLKISQIYNGVDVDRYRPLPAPSAVLPEGFCSDNEILIGTVGRLQGEKDQLTLIRAFGILVRNGAADIRPIKLIIVGDGPMRADVEALIQAEALSDYVWMTGSRDDIPELMCCFDIFVLPSLGEGISNTILEAMATGVPVVATRVGGNPELVVEGETGFMVDPGNPEMMAAAIQRYIEDPGLIHRHGAEGRLRAETVFSIRSMVDKYTQLYDSEIARSESRRLGVNKTISRNAE